MIMEKLIVECCTINMLIEICGVVEIKEKEDYYGSEVCVL